MLGSPAKVGTCTLLGIISTMCKGAHKVLCMLWLFLEIATPFLEFWWYTHL